MKRKVIVTFLSILTVLILSFIVIRRPKNAQIIITSRDIANSEESYAVKEGSTIELGGYCDLSITVKNISKKGIVIKTNTPMCDRDDGRINLNTHKTEFRIQTGEQLILTTPTMDASNTYYLKISSISK